MDLSKLPDGQRQQLEQLQKQFQEHQAQQQKQQEESAAAAAAAAVAAAAVQQQPPTYDPSQVHQSYGPSQAYDQSYYYNYNYQDPSQPQQQYDASYYQNYYPNAYQQQHQYTQPETVAATAYTVPSEQQRNDGSGSGSLGPGQVQDPYVDPGNQVNLAGTQPNPGYPVPPGLNPAAAAAVAALSQLTQFAGTMGAAERAIGGGGYGPPMAAGGHYGQGHFRPPVGVGGGRRGGGGGRGNFGLRGRGRGRGGGRGRGPSHPVGEANAKPSQGAMRVAWCELCRVDCTSKEILEQHKNGKRHQKNLQNLQEIKEKEENPQENEADNQTKTDDEREKKPWMKRKMKGGGVGRGGKRLRTGPAKPKVVIPLMCDLCNVKCDTQEVFDRHVGGKKHIAKLKRFQGHQAMYGPTAVQALYPPNPLSQTLAPSPAPAPAQNPNPQLADAPLQFGTQVSTAGVQ